MNRTVYQIWRLNPSKNQWFRYKHIPDCDTAEVCRDMFRQHREGDYRGNQFKTWMVNDRFKLVHVDMTITDIEII